MIVHATVGAELVETQMRIHVEQMRRAGVPEGLREGVARYLVCAIQPGSFLLAVLSNDLKGAIAHGDDDIVAGLRGLVRFLVNDAPAPAWGSPLLVRAWLEQANEPAASAGDPR